MMKRDFTPRSLAILAIAGSVLAASTWLLNFVHLPEPQASGYGLWSALWAYRLRAVIVLLPPALGVALSFWAEKRFKRAFLKGQWTEAELASTKSLVEQPFWTWSATLAVFGSVLWLVVDRHMRGASLVYLLVLPVQTVGRLRQLIAPIAARNSVLADLQNLQPIRSEHWGDPRA
jgi:hypothetical protein